MTSSAIAQMEERAARAARQECARRKDFRDYDAVYSQKFAQAQRGELNDFAAPEPVGREK